MTRNNPEGVDPEWVRIGQTLRAIREIKGFDLGEFATELGISYSYLSNIEAGRKRLTPQMLARCADLLGVKQVAIVREGYFPKVVAS